MDAHPWWGGGVITRFQAELALTASGQVTHCTVTQVSNRPDADQFICAAARAATLIPATGANGAHVPSNFQLVLPQLRITDD